jgi:hypothetical protein
MTFSTVAAQPSAAKESEMDNRAKAADGSCSVCGHQWSVHDTLGARYCAATKESSLSRGCICRKADR